MIKSCYIHIPFCNKICSYCDFCKIIYNETKIDNYLIALEQEIKKRYKGEVLETIYIGGGTPSSLTINQLEKLFNILNSLKKSKTCEYTIEGNIETTSKEKLKLYKKYGINRLSYGIETIDEDNLKLLERPINKEQIIKVIKESKEVGFNNINVDLMYALPNENIEVLQKDIDFILSLDIEHISTYSLIIEDNTKLKIKNYKNISEDLDYEMYRKIIKSLKENNYIHYEISNFSKRGYESKHNKCYWYNNEYYGFGLGASSYIDNERISNTRSLSNYILGKNIYEKEKLTKEDKIEYEIMLNLRLIEGINLERFRKRYSINLKDIYNYKELVKNNFLIEENNYLKIPEDKLYISNEIIVKFLQSKV